MKYYSDSYLYEEGITRKRIEKQLINFLYLLHKYKTNTEINDSFKIASHKLDFNKNLAENMVGIAVYINDVYYKLGLLKEIDVLEIERYITCQDLIKIKRNLIHQIKYLLLFVL